MTIEEMQDQVNKMNDTYLEEVINAHEGFDEEDRDAVNRVIEYRKMTVPLKLTVKDHHYETVLRKTGTLPNEIMFDEKYVHIENVTNVIYANKQEVMTCVVVLTRASKVNKEMEKVMGKHKAMAAMNLREIYNHYLKDTDHAGIIIYGGNNPYPVSMERIEEILKIK